jgi:hypothetical protein
MADLFKKSELLSNFCPNFFRIRFDNFCTKKLKTRCQVKIFRMSTKIKIEAKTISLLKPKKILLFPIFKKKYEYTLTDYFHKI